MREKPFAVVPLDLGTVESGNEQTGHPAQHLGEFAHIGMVWQTSGASSAWARGGFAGAQTIDFAALVSTNATAATKMRLRLDNAVISTQAGLYDSGALGVRGPTATRADGLYHSFLELPSAVSASNWRIDISGHTGDFSAAALVLGKRIQPATFYDREGGFRFGVEDLGSLEVTRWGVPGEMAGRVFRSLQLKFGWLSEADMEEKFRPLAEQLGKRGVSYWCFDPGATAYRQARTYLGWFSDMPYATGATKPNAFESQFQILSMI